MSCGRETSHTTKPFPNCRLVSTINYCAILIQWVLEWFVTQQLWRRTELDEIDNTIEKYNFLEFTQDKVLSQNSANAIREIKS